MLVIGVGETMSAHLSALPWCENCKQEVEAETNESNGFT